MRGFFNADSQASVGLAGTNNSLGYRVAEIERHFHSPEQIYGLTANTMARKATARIVVTGGSDAWGTELILHNGATIESGSSTKRFDLNRIYVSTVGTANRRTFIEFYKYLVGTPVACVFTDAGNTVDKAAHGLLDGYKVILPSIVTTTGINIYTVYYVVNKAADTFQLALTSGGAAVELVTNGTGTYYSLGAAGALQELAGETLVSRVATDSDGISHPMQMARMPCNYQVSARAWAEGGANAISFHLGLHTYDA
jgi:hypothetical protein